MTMESIRRKRQKKIHQTTVSFVLILTGHDDVSIRDKHKIMPSAAANASS
jgi:hypothetical protein